MNYTKDLTSQLTIQESHKKSGNNIEMLLDDSMTATEEINSVYKIIRQGDTAFCRSDIY
jgi:hypothetical protein